MFSLGVCFLLAVGFVQAVKKFFEMLVRNFLKVYGFAFVCKKFYVNEKFYVNKYLPKAKNYIDVSIHPLVYINLCKLVL